ncbi:hypothetical protein MKO06_05810 [Gramella sp. GC03-9]|uniref:Adhesin domain-containing protein n=1 Tax=Christiangramia oceanisediminis TaxID=2920386 RepID=A0A9X2I4U6_9FLAO|nr:hypothetical protein [Gramella oceanisediminis]MCP9199412.1 hypothetical protein [Gramella oceanisediminis]
MMRPFCILFLLFGIMAHAQRETMETIDARNIKILRIATDEVYQIKLLASKTSDISIKTRSEGEYFRDIYLDTSIKDGVLKINSRYPQRLAGGYDKLSAHKVFSMEVEIEVPEGLEISITSNLASVIATGNFESIQADLKQGYCKLLNFSGSARINTYSGDILVEAHSGKIEATTRNGKLVLPDFLPGQMPLRLTSIDGDIQVRKTKY